MRAVSRPSIVTAASLTRCTTTLMPHECSRRAALRRGAIEFLPTDDQARFLAFRRTAGAEDLLVGFNRGEAAYTWKIPTPDGGRVSQVFTASGEADKVAITAGAGEAAVTLPPLEGVVLRVARPE